MRASNARRERPCLIWRERSFSLFLRGGKHRGFAEPFSFFFFFCLPAKLSLVMLSGSRSSFSSLSPSFNKFSPPSLLLAMAEVQLILPYSPPSPPSFSAAHQAFATTKRKIGEKCLGCWASTNCFLLTPRRNLGLTGWSFHPCYDVKY